MNRTTSGPACRAGVALAIAGALASPAGAFLGVGDTSFVTVIANPADDAHWVSELDNLARQLTVVQSTLQEVALARAYAGDPEAAAVGVGDLPLTTAAVANLAAAPATAGALQLTWTAQPAAAQGQATNALLAAGPGLQMQVFGQSQPRATAAYAGLAADAAVAAGARAEIAQEQNARADVAGELARAWSDYQGAQTESQKQAILSKIEVLQTQSQLLEARRRALLDDLALADRQGRAQDRLTAQASDEPRLAEAAALDMAVAARAQAADTQRTATLAKGVPAAPAPDYDGLRLWTTADTANP